MIDAQREAREIKNSQSITAAGEVAAVIAELEYTIKQAKAAQAR